MKTVFTFYRETEGVESLYVVNQKTREKLCEAVVIPKERLSDAAKEAPKSALFFLCSKENKKIYVGTFNDFSKVKASDGFEEWTTAIVFNPKINKTERASYLSYLKYLSLINIKAVAQYDLKNRGTLKMPKVSDLSKIVAKYYLSEMKYLLSYLGFSPFGSYPGL